MIVSVSHDCVTVMWHRVPVGCDRSTIGSRSPCWPYPVYSIILLNRNKIAFTHLQVYSIPNTWLILHFWTTELWALVLHKPYIPIQRLLKKFLFYLGVVWEIEAEPEILWNTKIGEYNIFCSYMKDTLIVSRWKKW